MSHFPPAALLAAHASCDALSNRQMDAQKCTIIWGSMSVLAPPQKRQPAN